MCRPREKSLHMALGPYFSQKKILTDGSFGVRTYFASIPREIPKKWVWLIGCLQETPVHG